MDTLSPIAILILAATIAGPAGSQPPDPVARWQTHIAEASRRFGIPHSWIVRVIRAESHGLTERNGQPIRSPVAAMGLMQLMPGTWATMRARLKLGDDPDDPRDNILAGSFFLRLLYDRFGYPGLFAAYDAGPERYAGFLQGKSTLPKETQVYLTRVTETGLQPSIDRQQPLGEPLFFVGGANGKSPPSPPSSLFVPLDRQP